MINHILINYILYSHAYILMVYRCSNYLWDGGGGVIDRSCCCWQLGDIGLWDFRHGGSQGGRHRNGLLCKAVDFAGLRNVGALTVSQ